MGRDEKAEFGNIVCSRELNVHCCRGKIERERLIEEKKRDEMAEKVKFVNCQSYPTLRVS